MYTCDYELFLWLNFDGGALLDKIMVAISTPTTWSWLYVMLLYLAWRGGGWRGVLLYLVAVAGAMGLSDMIAGIFKHSGLLGDLWASFPARLRPMHTPELQGLVHSVKVGGQYGTVSAHAATMVSLAVVTAPIMRRRWLTIVLWSVVVLTSYSRIYLAYHFPIDIALGAMTGLISGYLMLLLYRYAAKRWLSEQNQGEEQEQ